jgi:hypothetical protein
MKRVDRITQGQRIRTTAVKRFEQEICRNYDDTDLAVSCERKENRTHYSNLRHRNTKKTIYSKTLNVMVG